MDANRMPGDAEAAAAAAGMAETYGRNVFACGDFVSGETSGKRWSGRVLDVDGDRLHVELDGAWLSVSSRDVIRVPASDVTH